MFNYSYSMTKPIAAYLNITLRVLLKQTQGYKP